MKFSCNISLKFSRRQNFMKSYITKTDTTKIMVTWPWTNENEQKLSCITNRLRIGAWQCSRATQL